jgi:hypothetical protein
VLHGPVGVLTVVLFETALGSFALLWLAPLWGVVRPGFFKLAGATVLACAALAWLAGHGELRRAGGDGRMAALWLGLFVLALLTWQALLYGRRPAMQASAAMPSTGDRLGRSSTRASAATLPAGAKGRVGDLARWVGVAAVAPGLVAAWPLAVLSGRTALGLLALLTGALFLGTTVDGLLLGHWYLVDRRLSNRPILALATWFIAGVAAALVSAALGGARGTVVDQSLSPLLSVPDLTVYLAVGLVLLCGLLAAFIRALVRGNSIQAATGMFYLAVIMALAAEFAAKVYFFPA